MKDVIRLLAKRKRNYRLIAKMIVADAYLNDGVTFHFGKLDRAFCYINTRDVFLDEGEYKHPDEVFLFDLLHELGHIHTNTSKMKRCEQEFYATQWAIERFEEYGLKLPPTRQFDFQKYVWDCLITGVLHRGKNMPSIYDMSLDWHDIRKEKLCKAE